MTSSTLLPSGYLSTSGNQIIDSAGRDVRIASVGWNQNFDNIPSTVAQMAAAGFNAIRLSWVDASLSTDLPRIQQIVAAAAANGMKVILDHHTDEVGTPADGWGSQQSNGLWYDSGPGTDGTNGAGVTGTVTAAQFQADWMKVAQTFAGNSTVIGFDLDNEPLEYGSAPTALNWGGGGPTDIHAMYQTVGDAIQAVDPGALIIAEGPIAPLPLYNFDLTHVASDPVVLNIANKVVYSAHLYPSSIGAEPVDSGAAFVANINQAYGYLETQNIAPVWIGEIGASLDGTADSAGSNLAEEQAWAQTMVDYLNGKDGAIGGPTFTGSQQGMSTDWWNWGYDPGQYPDGTLNADGTLKAGQQTVYSQLQQKPLGPVVPPANASANDTVSLAGSTSAIVDAAGNAWTITSGGQVAVNGVTDTSTSSVTEMAYVNGTVWVENTSKLWWGKTTPSAAWAPGAGTATSPLPAKASANDTVVLAGSTSAIVDAAGNAWTITSGGQVAVNGVTDTSTSSVTEMAYVSGTVWVENTSKLWWGKTTPSAAWAPGAGTATSPLPAKASANDTVVLAGSTSAIVDAAGNAWTITSGGQVAVNGVTDTSTSSVTEMAYVSGTVWVENTSKLWWGKTTPSAAWAPGAGTATSPLPAKPSVITLNVSEDAYLGDAQFTVSVDGTQVGGTMTAMALHSSGNAEVFNLTGNWSSTSAHAVQISFINDANGGSASLDRNLYVNSVAVNGTTEAGTAAAIYSNGADSFTVGASTSPMAGPMDVVTLSLAEDAWNGNAQFTLSIDGKQITTPENVTALHSANAWETIAFSGNFGAGAHTVGVSFTNAASGGSPSTNRDLYVNGINVSGQHYGSGVTTMMSNGTTTFNITTTH